MNNLNKYLPLGSVVMLKGAVKRLMIIGFCSYSTDDKADEYQLLGTELAKELADNGFNEVLLPEAILSDEFEITKITYESGEYLNTANITFKYNNESGSFFITKYKCKEERRA